MSTSTALIYLKWWHEELVHALLWGVWRHVIGRTGAAQDRAFDRFTSLIDSVDCWPCRVSYIHPRLAREGNGPFRAPLEILSGAAAADADYWEDDWS